MSTVLPGSQRQETQPLLSISRGGDLAWRTDSPAYVQVAADVLAKWTDAHGLSCQCCGWESNQNRMVQDPENPSGQLFLCSLCVLPTAIGYALNNGKGRLIVLPELTQTEVINLFRWAYLGLYAKKMLDDKRSWLYQQDANVFLKKAEEMAPLNESLALLNSMIMQRGEEQLRKQFSTNVPSEMFFPLALSRVSDETYYARRTRLAPIRFVPSYSALSEDEWVAVFKEAKFSAAEYAAAYPEKML